LLEKAWGQGPSGRRKLQELMGFFRLNRRTGLRAVGRASASGDVAPEPDSLSFEKAYKSIDFDLQIVAYPP